jgi:hypothetical protein
VGLANAESAEMMNLAPIPQSVSIDIRLVLNHARSAVVTAKEPRRSATGERCALSSDGSAAAFGKETPVRKYF